MTIIYTEKGYGLHEAIQRAGHSLVQQDGAWIASNEAAVQAIIDNYSLDSAKALICDAISAHSKSLRDKAIASISAGEMASWPIKLAEAATFAATGAASDAPMLSVEAGARGISLPELVSKVGSKGQMFAGLESVISGTDGKHRDAIDALDTFDAVLSYDWRAGWPDV